MYENRKLIVAVARVDTGSWVRVHHAEGSAVVGVILDRHSAAIVVVGEECRRVEALIVDHGSAVPPLAVGVLTAAAAAERADRAHALATGMQH